MSKERESNFDFDELFFSRTDKRGVIASGNSVFQRVSQYEWEEMLGRPHKVVRHPEMPRGVFSLLWDTIAQDKMIGAYVNNQAKDGSNYWVFALVSPIDDGYLSVRLKPSSHFFEVVKEKYIELAQLEKRKKLTPAQSQETLLAMINELGFESYEHFMIEALMQELESRQKVLGEEPIAELNLLRKALESGSFLQEKSEGIFEEYKKTSLVPMNLEVQAARIGEEAASMATISAQYDNLAKEIQDEINKFMVSGKLVQEKVKDCQFFVCNSILQREIYNFFEKETKPSPIQKANEMNILALLQEQQINNAKSSLVEIQTEFSEFKRVCNDVKKLSIGLEMVSISGKIEAAKLNRNSGELSGLLDQLTKFKDSLKQSLKEINDIGNDLVHQVSRMNEILVN
ncbi:PAS domain-containing protein [Halobacteriovorax sp. ZH4_bin.1]|uniref:PAS domain-containing protein n=1 Tax=unclassified Halobacteriovorax TaxID=2639665 RepID=UPI00371FDB40